MTRPLPFGWRQALLSALALVYIAWSEMERQRLTQAVTKLQVSRKKLSKAAAGTPAPECLATYGDTAADGGTGATPNLEPDDEEFEHGLVYAMRVAKNIPGDVYLHGIVFLIVFGWLVRFVWNELALVSSNRIQEQGDAADEDDHDMFASGAQRKRPKSVEQRRIRERIHETLTFSLREFVFYRMDYLLSTWSSAKPVALLLATYLLIMAGATLYYSLSSSSDVTYSESVWVAWTFVADPGTHAEERGSAERFVALLLTIGGMLIFALMIGIIADGVSDLLDDLKKGRSRVIESGHTLVLGWSDKVIPTIRELAIANESEGGGVVVLLCERQKEEMEAELASALTDETLYETKVVCRSGSPLIMTDLLKVSAQTAKAVIVLSDPEVDADESDARAVRIVMSLTGIDVRCHIVVEMCDVDNRELVLLVGKGNVETVVAHDIIGRLMIQCARQPGLAQILEQLLGFAGDEFYLEEWPQLVGKTFLDASFAFDQAVPIGVKPADPEAAERQMQMLKRLDTPPLSPARSRGSHESARPSSSRFPLPPGRQQQQKSDSRGHRSSSDPTTSSFFDVDGHRAQPVASVSSTAAAAVAAAAAKKEGEASDSDSDSGSSSDETAPSPPVAPINPLNVAKRTISINSARSSTRSRGGSLSSVFGTGPRTVLLNPPDGYILQKGDQIVVIAEDDDSYDASSDGDPVCEAAQRARFSVNAQHPMHFVRKSERLLFCGWRRDMDDMISELDKLVVKNSELVLMSTIPIKTRLRRFKDANKVDLASLRNLRIIHEEGNPVLRRHLEKLDLKDFSSILILADEAFETNMQTADSRSLASMLLIRDIIEKRHMQALADIGDLDAGTMLEPLPIIARSPSSPAPRRHVGLKEFQELQGQQKQEFSPSEPEVLRTRKDSGTWTREGAKASDRTFPENDERKRAATPLQKTGNGVSDRSLRTSDGDEDEDDDDQLNEMISGIQQGKLRTPAEAAQHRLQRQSTAEVRQSIKRTWCPREHQSEREDPDTIIISEILDSRTKSLISVAEVSDYVMSNEIVACAMAMVSEDRSINIVLTELLSASGCEIQVRSCLEYCEAGEVLDWWTVMARARKRCEVAVGYRPRDYTEALINPRKKSKLRVWARGDSIVVLTHCP
ncbi:Ion channel CASTOR [Hondaea fermentalgiana]|uniref:Ion channel CASTOR n=1 Tax=Hondaea fermentalgiana TaxID=2315210 RepID=A0A2R5G7Z1_9STRA|nr:Ion channel CASTOR [Hondaea fermentalgiana]|eukprot:GBG27176.1 Ion channel CASTOR [Hondaea fermentalgiana]